jgi:hypothetical protein
LESKCTTSCHSFYLGLLVSLCRWDSICRTRRRYNVEYNQLLQTCASKTSRSLYDSATMEGHDCSSHVPGVPICIVNSPSNSGEVYRYVRTTLESTMRLGVTLENHALDVWCYACCTPTRGVSCNLLCQLGLSLTAGMIQQRHPHEKQIRQPADNARRKCAADLPGIGLRGRCFSCRVARLVELCESSREHGIVGARHEPQMCVGTQVQSLCSGIGWSREKELEETKKAPREQGMMWRS